jgi:hypothetical protein
MRNANLPIRKLSSTRPTAIKMRMSVVDECVEDRQRPVY